MTHVYSFLGVVELTEDGKGEKVNPCIALFGAVPSRGSTRD